MQGFDLKEMLYTDFKPLPDNIEKEIGARYVDDVGDMVRWGFTQPLNLLHVLLCEGLQQPNTRLILNPTLGCSQCDVVTINAPLHEGTKGLFNDELLGKMKKGSYLVNTARGAIVDRESLVRAIDSGHLQGTLHAFLLMCHAPQLLCSPVRFRC